MINRLLDKIQEKNEKIEELQNRLGKQQAESNPEPQQEEEKEAFFKVIKPSVVGANERKNAIVEWFKSKEKFHTATIPEMAEKVFGHRTKNSSHKEYKAMVNALQEEPRVIPTESHKGRYKEYKLSNKVSRE